MKGKVNVNIEHDVRFSYEINDRFTIEAVIRNSGEIANESTLSN